MKIHDINGFVNPARIRIVLAEKGLESQVQYVKVDLFQGEHKKPAFLAKNPTGTVPVLELEDGTYIGESSAITQYLDNLDGQPTLTGRTPREKAVIQMMNKRADDQLIDGVGVYFHHATPGLGPINERNKSPDWALRKQWGQRHGERAIAGMKYFDSVLQTQSFVAGDTFSMADITVFAALMHADLAGLKIPEECEALIAWRARIAERPSVKHRSGQQLDAEDLHYIEPLMAHLNA